MASVDFSGSAMIALYPRENEANALALEGEQPAADLHVTMLFLGTAREAIPLLELTTAVVGGIASETEALAGAVGGVAQFEDAGDGAPLVLLPDVPGLTELGAKLREELARVGVESASEHGFVPHVTVSYGADPDVVQDRLGADLHFDTLSVVVGNDRFDYPLQSPPQTLLSASDHPGAALPSGGLMGREATATAHAGELELLALRARGLEGNEAVLAAITAAGVADEVEMATVYDLAKGSPGERRFYAETIAAGFSETRHAFWPSDAELADHGEVLFRGDNEGVFRLPGDVLVYAQISGGWFQARFAAARRSEGAEAVATFSEAYPPLYAETDDSGTVPVTFWTNGQWGPTSRLRRIEASPWDAIEGNYAEAVHEELTRLMGDFEPGAEGQLLLWQGPPGTGKTWALRALASEWSEWAEFHYITDPDAFFVSNPSYMIDVLLSDSYEELTSDGDVLTSESAGKWKVLILEDTGELLSANAKEAYGQGLSRLLNVVDGMVGQGLRVLALVTTNDELGDLHPAAVRPGRCASQIAFGPLSAAEASVWLEEEVEEGGTLAELYARRGGSERAFEEETAEEQSLAAAIVRASEPFPGLRSIAAAVEPQTNASQLRWEAVLMLEGEPTDDGRMIDPGAISWRDLPLSLMGINKTTEGHSEAQVVGRIDEIWRAGNLVMGRGVFDDGEFAQEIARLVSEQMLRGVSVDLAIRSYELRPRDDSLEQADEGDLIDQLLGDVEMLYVVTEGSIGAATIVPFPAFADAEIALVASAPLTWRTTRQSGMTLTKSEAPAPDRPSSEGEADALPVVTASAAGLAPLVPPAEWFEDPKLEEPTPLQITEDGRIFGHAAVWDVCHIGFEDACVLAPHSPSGYRYFHLGEVMVALEPSEGENVLALALPCGQITLGTGHASLRLSRADAVEHYDDTGTLAAHAVAGEDEHGIWFAGALSPDLPEERVRELRGAKISGDWRSVGGELELVAMLAVNVPGFPVPRVRVASGAPEPVGEALVAAGVADRRVLDAMREREEASAEIESLAEAQEIPAPEPVEEGPPSATLAEAALTTLAMAHARTAEAVERVLAAGPENGERAEREMELARQALGVLERFAQRETPPAPDIHVHVPEREVTVEGAHVTVEAAAPPEVRVEPQIDVHVPEQPPAQVLVAAPAPPQVTVEAPKPRTVRVEEDEDGTRRYISEEE